MHGAHPLGPRVLRRQADPDDDAEPGAARHTGGRGADAAQRREHQHGPGQHPAGAVRRLQLAARLGRHRVPERRPGVARPQGLQGPQLQAVLGEDLGLRQVQRFHTFLQARVRLQRGHHAIHELHVSA